MNTNLLSKTLTLGIVVLFIGVGIHPAFAMEEKTSSSENESNSKPLLNDWGINISFDPIYPNGENNWYISCVTLTITYNNETVKYVYVNGEIYIEPIILCQEGINLIEITAEDWEGNFMDPLNYEIAIDLTPPEICCWMQFYDGYFDLDIGFSDNVSGIGPLKFYIGNTLDKEYPAPPYETITIDLDSAPPLSELHSYIKFAGSDYAGHYKECYPFPKPENIYIIGLIKNRCLSKRYIKFSAKYIYTSNSGIVESEHLVIIFDKYFGLIGRNFILTRFWGWQVPTYN